MPVLVRGGTRSINCSFLDPPERATRLARSPWTAGPKEPVNGQYQRLVDRNPADEGTHEAATRPGTHPAGPYNRILIIERFGRSGWRVHCTAKMWLQRPPCLESGNGPAASLPSFGSPSLHTVYMLQTWTKLGPPRYPAASLDARTAPALTGVPAPGNNDLPRRSSSARSTPSSRHFS